ncbi:anti-sigma regulatory factor (Ser/Thr protein kinase) [Anoxybacillus vitaminiphilus]|uniref:Anti-sigma regulatory factor (Ser/Thr protein kinase) n=1 Tax=Paranoxybacillus vitaminiphilus TaxID=581036 RepID=A0A327YR83_9BACL|nr:ATP-binding protein [Anoxybacillus vitaminiphilus]RAK23528.1 anti-sigma regulatory factor (Ser/Thr protein kinase) [Anoxybacillus vitaminiphilus]
MKNFLTKFISNHKQTAPFIFSPFPGNCTYKTLKKMFIRGYLAWKTAIYLHFNEEKATHVFYYSLTKESFDEKNSHDIKHFLNFISEKILLWFENNQNINENLKTLNLDIDLHNAAIKAFATFQSQQTEIHAQVSDEMLDHLKEMQKREWEIYRDVIYAASKQKVKLILPNEVERYKQNSILLEYDIEERVHIPQCRNKVKSILESMNFPASTITSWLLVISEAITNSIKHAEKGKLILLYDNNNKEVIAIVEDKGPGINLKDLPNAVFVEGYSTKKSLGQGFTIMLKIASKIILSTSKFGTTLILVLKQHHNESFLKQAN